MEQIGGFDREIYLAENNIDVIKSIVKSKGAKNLKMKDGKMMVDLFSASAIMNVYNKVNPNNKQKMEKLANGNKSRLDEVTKTCNEICVEMNEKFQILSQRVWSS